MDIYDFTQYNDEELERELADCKKEQNEAQDSFDPLKLYDALRKQDAVNNEKWQRQSRRKSTNQQTSS